MFFVTIAILYVNMHGISFAQNDSRTLSTTPLNEPYISVSPDYFYPIEEILYIEGRANPKALVVVVLQKPGDRPVEFSIQADSIGEWVIAKKVYLKSGNWEVRARQQVGEQISDWSNPRVIQSTVTGVHIFGFNVRYVVIAFIVALFLALIVSLFIYSLNKIQKAKLNFFKKQINETETRFHRGVTDIRKDIVEKESGDRVLKDLEKLEKEFDENIEDIES